jgi:hypothetical protein
MLLKSPAIYKPLIYESAHIYQIFCCIYALCRPMSVCFWLAGGTGPKNFGKEGGLLKSLSSSVTAHFRFALGLMAAGR